jgi:hypothetical protein
MGHHELAGLPRTRPFKRVIALLGNGAGGGAAVGIGPGSLEEIADATLDASDEGLEQAKTDEGLGYSLYLMAELAHAATDDDFASAIARLGLPAPFAPIGTPDVSRPNAAAPAYTVFDLVGGFTAVVDRHLQATRARSDIGEMAQLCAAESLSSLCGQKSLTLFGESHETVRESLQKLSSEKGFARLAHDFFARFSRRFIEYHLSRELSNHVGANRRFSGTGAHNQFLRQLDDHCRVATGVVRQFAGKWYTKHQFKKDLTLRKTKYFASHAIDKVRDALRYQEARDAN